MMRRSAGIALRRGLAAWTSSQVGMIRPTGYDFPEASHCGCGARRSFVAKVRYNLRGFGPEGSALKINFCRNDYDLHSAPRTLRHEQYQYAKTQFVLREIMEKTKEEFGTNKDLEYYNGHEWLPLKNMDDIKPWKGGMYALDIRIPDQYEDVNVYTLQDANAVASILEGESMVKILRSIVRECQRTETARSSVKRFHLCQGTVTLPTREWLLKLAETDVRLRSVLLRRPGALAHLVQCLDLDLVWQRNPKVNAPEGSMELNRGYLTWSCSVA